MQGIDWFAEHPLLWWLFVLSVVLFLASLVGIPLVLARMRGDYFVRKGPMPSSWLGQHALVRVVVRLVKNALGLGLCLAGIAMLVLPGPGIVTILVGLTMLEFPGKRKLELWILRRPRVHSWISRIRARVGRDPLILPPESES